MTTFKRNPKVRKLINKLLDERDAKGAETYGTPLDDAVRYDWQDEVMAELLDGLQYQAKYILELKAKLKLLDNEGTK